MKNAEVVVLFNDELNKERREGLSKKVIDFEGVISVRLPDQLPHLMIVGYNVEATEPYQVLENVENNGVEAQLIGES